MDKGFSEGDWHFGHLLGGKIGLCREGRSSGLRWHRPETAKPRAVSHLAPSSPCRVLRALRACPQLPWRWLHQSQSLAHSGMPVPRLWGEATPTDVLFLAWLLPSEGPQPTRIPPGRPLSPPVTSPATHSRPQLEPVWPECGVSGLHVWWDTGPQRPVGGLFTFHLPFTTQQTN